MEKERTWIRRLSHKPHVLELVRRRLGCQCPEEVFDHYQVQYINCGDIPVVQLIMGRKLLIRMVDAPRLTGAVEPLSELLDQGRRERDRRRLNRFRLVVTGPLPALTPTETDALQPFLGERVHLHIMAGLDF